MLLQIGGVGSVIFCVGHKIMEDSTIHVVAWGPTVNSKDCNQRTRLKFLLDGREI